MPPSRSSQWSQELSDLRMTPNSDSNGGSPGWMRTVRGIATPARSMSNSRSPGLFACKAANAFPASGPGALHQRHALFFRGAGPQFAEPGARLGPAGRLVEVLQCRLVQINFGDRAIVFAIDGLDGDRELAGKFLSGGQRLGRRGLRAG